MLRLFLRATDTNSFTRNTLFSAISTINRLCSPNTLFNRCNCFDLVITCSWSRFLCFLMSLHLPTTYLLSTFCGFSRLGRLGKQFFNRQPTCWCRAFLCNGNYQGDRSDLFYIPRNHGGISMDFLTNCCGSARV